MKVVKRMEMILTHLCCVCSLLFLAVRALNWNNPYMGILDRNMWIADCLCLCSILSAVLSILLNIGTKRVRQSAGPSETTMLAAAAKKEMRDS